MSYRFEGSYGQPGSSGPNGRSTKTNGNKGVMRTVRATKRAEAEARNTNTLPERRRSTARAEGFSRVSEMNRAGVFVVSRKELTGES